MADGKDFVLTLRTLYNFIVDVTYEADGHRFVGYKDDVELDKHHPEIEAALNDAQNMLKVADGWRLVPPAAGTETP